MLFILAFNFRPAVAQIMEINILTNKYCAEGIVDIDSLTKEELYYRTFQWLTEVKYPTTSEDQGIQPSTELNNKIVISEYFNPDSLSELNNYRVRFILTFEFRDSLYLFNYSDFTYFGLFGKAEFEEMVFNEFTDDMRKDLIAETEDYIRTSMSELKNYVINYCTSENW